MTRPRQQVRLKAEAWSVWLGRTRLGFIEHNSYGEQTRDGYTVRAANGDFFDYDKPPYRTKRAALARVRARAKSPGGTDGR